MSLLCKGGPLDFVDCCETADLERVRLRGLPVLAVNLTASVSISESGWWRFLCRVAAVVFVDVGGVAVADLEGEFFSSKSLPVT